MVDLTNPVSVWAVGRAFGEARRQGGALIGIIEGARKLARANVRVWDPTPRLVPRGPRIDVVA